ncbi:type IV toxin-antitoxin system AbiEi family antitoxin [Nocardia sp. GCM10030253]|uniref:type IV toxin-antitoxin system AbiEi family antitoxin n=1 Tax=Nocardia sp. GCM10030253 TaxID=3273404 RepID=UPI00363E6726
MGGIDEPFPGSWAVHGRQLSAWELRKYFDRIHPDVYIRKGVELDARVRAQAVGHWAKGDGVLVGYSAAVMHGTSWLDDKPAEIALPRRARPPRKVLVYRDVIPDDQVCTLAGFRCTTPARTAFDLGRRLPFDDAVEVLDALCHATKLEAEEVEHLAGRYPGMRGCARLRHLLPYVDGGAESLQETRTRLLLRQAGLPTPETQIRVHGPDGMTIARLDMGWRRWKVAVEYDGAHHWTTGSQRAWDIDRTALLESQGWTLIRVSATLLTTRPHTIIDRTHRALRAHGANL